MEKQILAKFLLHVGDTQLILAQRLAEWCGHAPELEIDIALANIGLDILGQGRNFLTLAGEYEGVGRDEDQLAFFRNEREFLNLLLVEQPNQDFGSTIFRQWLMDHYHCLLFTALTQSFDAKVAALAVKSLKEVKYHLRFSTTWMERLSLSTDEAHSYVQNAVDDLWRFTAEMFELDVQEQSLVSQGILPNLDEQKAMWETTVLAEIERLTLTVPELGAYRRGAKQGIHTEHLGYILAELQYMQRTYPNMIW